MGNSKNGMRTLVFAIITAMLLGIFSACSDRIGDGEKKLKIVTTLFPQYDFARQIVGEQADVTLLLTPGSESHTYEPTPKDILKIQNADIFIYIGGESEVWVKEVLDSVKNDKLKTLRLMDCITPLAADHANDTEEKHESNEYDEHIFTSLRNAEAIMEEICSTICEVDNENAEEYRENSKAYSDKISNLDLKFTEMINNSARKKVVFGDRFPFIYFAHDYGLEYSAAFSGCSSETEASTAVISELISTVKIENIPTVFYIEFSSRTIADKIADAAGVKTAMLHSCHNISKEDLENHTSYVDLMTQNYQNLSEALN